ncbi:hypothetical protein [Paraburkholderia xenovorans]|uniref:hypothetical protein n=1 Tax=Paraburkholderia xenovorans TaxID=36873 RepID=UPI0019E52FB2|nr:hypothetical protein [Paraburkholderia xenovorans]NPT36332.1 hypothetical protein [Paraburkholderia xenovorans]
MTFESRERTTKDRLDFAEGALVGALKLLARARRGEDTRSNCRCIAQWLRAAAQQMDELAEKHQ